MSRNASDELRRSMARARVRATVTAIAIGAGTVFVLCTLAVPETVDRLGLVSCNNTPIAAEGPYTPVEVVRLAWFWECTYETSNWGFATIMGEIALAVIFTAALASLARDWNGGPPYWANELIGFAAGALVAIAGLGLALVAGTQFAYANRDANYPGYITGAAYLACAAGAFASCWVGVKAGGAVTRTLVVRTGGTAGVLVAGSTAVAIAVATGVILLVGAIALVLLAIYAAVLVFQIVMGLILISYIGSKLSA